MLENSEVKNILKQLLNQGAKGYELCTNEKLRIIDLIWDNGAISIYLETEEIIIAHEKNGNTYAKIFSFSEISNACKMVKKNLHKFTVVSK